MKKEFVMRGQTPGAPGTSGTENQEILSFSGHKKGYAYRLTEFLLYPSTGTGTTSYELNATLTAGKNAVDPTNVDFRNEGLIGCSMIASRDSAHYNMNYTVINDMFLITQDLILTVRDTQSDIAINWQCKFESVKMSGPEAAVTNYRQFMISDE